MEMFDICDELGRPTGEIVSRKDAHALGIRHRTAHIWVVRNISNRYQVLLQRRSYSKDCFPGKLDTSSAGHIKSGDEPLESAIRELKEELSIQVMENDLTYIGQFPIQYEKVFYQEPFKDNEISFVYLCYRDVDPTQLDIQKEELDSVAWYDLEDTIQKVKSKDEDYCVPIGGISLLEQCLKK